MDIFLGRFHPLVVHLPISFILLGGLMYLLSRRKRFEHLTKATSFVLLLGSITAIVAAFLGWLVAEDKGYDADTLFLHRWVGIAVATGSVLLWLLQTKRISGSEKQVSILYLVLVLGVSITGHLGGNLTHGEGYLTEHAPEFIQNLFPLDNNELLQLPDHPDSVNVYADLISPILVSKCGNCHDEAQQKGGLNLISVAGINAGGDDGEVISPNQPYESELFMRTTLPLSHKKFMPLNGTPLSFTESELIKWWIEEGASFEAKLTDLSMSPVLSSLILRDYEFDVKPRPFYELLPVEPVSADLVDLLDENGFVARQIAENINYISIERKPNINEITSDEAATLAQVAKQVIWLNLNNVGLNDEHLETLRQLTNLHRLDLNSNELTDEGLAHLSGLSRLESLNLYNTNIGDKGLTHLESLTALKRLYVWQTEVTSTGVDQLKSKLDGVYIDTGIANN